jgi:hypothetical protein
VNIKTRLTQLERRHAILYPPQTQMTDEEFTSALRSMFAMGHLKFEGMRVVVPVGSLNEDDYVLCAKLAEVLTRRAEEHPEAPLVLLLPKEAQELLGLLEADQLALHAVPEWDEGVRHYLWPTPACERNGAEQLVRHLDAALDGWAEQRGEERPVTLDAVHEWVRALVSGNEERGA